MAENTLQAFVQKRRGALQRTQREVAERGGTPLSEGYLGQLERGFIKRPGLDHLLALARGLDVPVEDLVRAMGMLPEPDNRTHLMKEEVGHYIDNVARDLPDEDLERFRQSILENVREIDAELRRRQSPTRGSSEGDV